LSREGNSPTTEWRVDRPSGKTPKFANRGLTSLYEKRETAGNASSARTFLFLPSLDMCMLNALKEIMQGN